MKMHHVTDTFRILLILLALATAGRLSAQEIVAHRGASHDAPENTLAAFRLAWKQGADAIEGDFRLTKDEKIVCLHDKDLKRTAGDPREVAHVSLAELRKLEAGSWKAPVFAGESIPTLDEVLAVVPAGKRLFLEVKCGPEIIEPLRLTLSKDALDESQIIIISFDEEVIRQCRQHFPKIKAHWLTSYKQSLLGKWKPTQKQILKVLDGVAASGLDTKADPDRVTPAFVAKLRASGLEFHCWTVDTPALARHFQALGVDSITTNRPAWLRAQLRLDPSQ